MNKKLITLAVAGVLSSPAVSMAQVSYNVGVVSDYLFRGISQTHGGPAIQGGIDYAFSNGFYVGAWGSTVTWVNDFLGDGDIEIDLYGGYKGAITQDLGFDVGYITYNYPGKEKAIATVLANPNTQEVYVALNYKWLSAKYSHATSKHFVGWYGGAALDQNTKGSGYLELNANYDMGDGWTLVGHVGTQKIKNSVLTTGGVLDASYTDWKLGVTKDVGFGVVGLSYSDTDTKGTCNVGGGTNPYCWGDTGTVAGVSGPTGGFKDVSKGTAVLSFTKSF